MTKFVMDTRVLPVMSCYMLSTTVDQTGIYHKEPAFVTNKLNNLVYVNLMLFQVMNNSGK